MENDPFPRFFKKTAIFGGKTPVLMDFSKNRGEYQTRSKRTFAHLLGIRVSCETTQNTCFLGWFSAKTRNIDIQNLSIVQVSIFLCFKIQIYKTQRLHFAFYSHKNRLQYWPFWSVTWEHFSNHNSVLETVKMSYFCENAYLFIILVSYWPKKWNYGSGTPPPTQPPFRFFHMYANSVKITQKLHQNIYFSMNIDTRIKTIFELSVL